MEFLKSRDLGFVNGGGFNANNYIANGSNDTFTEPQ